MAFPRSLCIIIVVVIFSSVFMKNVPLAHENSIATAYHSVPEWEGLITPTHYGHLHASWTGRKQSQLSPRGRLKPVDSHPLPDPMLCCFLPPTS